MQVILLDKVVNLGNLGEIVKVKDGYARNFLIPSGPRPPRHRSQQGRVRSQARRTRKGRRRQAGRIAGPGREARPAPTVKLTQKAGVDGRLFGSVTNHDIAEELNKQGYKVAKSQVRMPNGPIKTVGDSTVSVALHTDVVVDITVTVLRRNRLSRRGSPRLHRKPPLGRLFLWSTASHSCPAQLHRKSTGLSTALSRDAARRAA